MAKRHGRHGARDDAPGLPTADALLALFWHTAFFMGGVMICVFIMAAMKRRRQRQLELENPEGFYSRVSEEDDPMEPSDLEGSALMHGKSPAKTETEVVVLSQVLMELKLDRYQRAFDRCGYDDWNEILEMDGGALDTLAARLKLAPNHADRFLQRVRQCRLEQQPQTALSQARQREAAKSEEDCVLL